jgi:hypothetical protein
MIVGRDGGAITRIDPGALTMRRLGSSEAKLHVRWERNLSRRITC